MTVTELLAALQQLHIEVMVCGDKLRVQAPSGALTPGLKAHLQALKAEVIAALTAPASEEGTTGEQEERLFQFAQTVSRIATVFPGTCQIERLPPNMTVAEWLAQ